MSVRVRQDSIRPHDMGILAACASIDDHRMQVATCTNLLWTDVEGIAIEGDCSTAWRVNHAACSVVFCANVRQATLPASRHLRPTATGNARRDTRH